MLEDRSYMREPANYRSSYPSYLILLFVNLGVFMLQEINSGYFHSPIIRYLMLSPEGISHGYLWQLFTFQFLHGEPLHLAFNLIALYFLGRAVEEMIGTKRFLQAYFASGTLGGVLQVILGFLVPGVFGGPTVGASAGICGLTGVFGTMVPEATILFMFIPMPAKFLVWITGAIATFYILVPAPSAFAYAHGAHLGGLLTGVAFVKWFMNSDWSLPQFHFKKAARPPELVSAPAGSFWKKSKPMAVDEDLPSDEFMAKEVDPILDKISAHGIKSLTDRERKILDAARAKMAKR